MNENKRNEEIAKGEDNALNSYLEARDRGSLNLPCEVCEEEEATIETNGKELCQNCYENACEQAEGDR